MAIKLRALVKHPAQVEGDTGLTVTKTNGVITVALDLGAFSTTPSVSDTDATTALLVTPGATADDPDVVELITIANLLATVISSDPELAAIAGLTSAADRVPYYTGSGTAALATFTAAGRALVDDADASAQRTTLGLVIGTNVQAYDAELAALAGLTSAADSFPYFTGSGTAALGTITTYGRSLVDDADASAAQTTLGISTFVKTILDDADAAAVRTTIGAVIGTDVQAQNARLADIAGITWTQGDVLYYNGTNLVDLAPGTSGHFLKTQGAGANPVWDAASGTATAASQAEEEAASSTTVFTTPGRQHFHPGVAKYWVYLTNSGGTYTNAASYNHTSITDNGVGDITLTIATDFSSANWVGAGISHSGGGTLNIGGGTIAAGSVGISQRDAAGSSVDANFDFIAFGDQ